MRGAGEKPTASRHWYVAKPKRSYSGASQPRAKLGSRPGSVRSGTRNPACAAASPAASATSSESNAKETDERILVCVQHTLGVLRLSRQFSAFLTVPDGRVA